MLTHGSGNFYCVKANFLESLLKKMNDMRWEVIILKNYLTDVVRGTS